MYDKSDPRSALNAPTATPRPAPTTFAGAEYGHFHADAPQIDDADGRTWLTRGQNFLVAYTEARPGAVVSRIDQPDEYVALLPNRDTAATVSAGSDTVSSDGYALIVVPPGDSAVTLPEGGILVRIFSTVAADLAAAASNAASYADQHPNVPALEPWPEPAGGYRLRAYSLDVPDEPGRFGRIWRTTNLMVNFLPPQVGPRDIRKLSPHYHDDFEQGSLALEGSFTHHLRWPWTFDMTQWRADEHALCPAPSLCVIPPPAIHTSRGMEPGVNQLVDIFSPPRIDFSLKPGWVLNADDYPMPAPAAAAAE
ncbi:hypothetical protein C2U72_05275 [Prosthecomicrobium hirschii]|uniref:hypothetical protein n=1 Tax=Prosthecodimorpha hirschii TaxID=665126 RepID=UPI001127F48A|nr:hypothetical protein [Prosthecomicrobium hirschii]TPQ52028.1 hypothetical protein C2U72_05275 [Prosthecomicrobium hirschii]